ncbi:BTB/POZ domain-containing protein 6-B-like [Condylostylus longicornis]|uniref:BTB/POZ domain-containing protein 6-B-like n=1 Tax=Condylostylus longicornis TaxID=2530218 RepID=UPI00244D9C96|nr:BTB/POZ domain-containing protein 6-B-like [Condylostylus longicornis]
MDDSLENQILPDEPWRKFLVGRKDSEQQMFSVNKLLLAKASPVFQRLFYGSTADNSDVILEPEVTPRAFSAMLNFIYTGTLRIGSFENACELYSVTVKYVLPTAVLACRSYLSQNLNAENICKAYEFAEINDEAFLKRQCKEIFPTLIKEVISNPSFMEIKLSTLREILSMDNLMISEVELFIALRNYVYVNDYLVELNEYNNKENQMQNAQEGEIYEPDGITIQKTIRNIEDLKYAIRQIRFLTFTKEQFVEIVAKSSLLSESEALAILINIVLSSNKVCIMPEGFSTSRDRRYAQSFIERTFFN